MKNTKLLMALVAAALSTTGLYSQVRLPHAISDGMVIQRNAEANLWGWGTPGRTVRISVSWSREKYSVKVGEDGRWTLKVKTPDASFDPQTITFDDGKKVTVSDVLVGDVWICGGQSNMGMPMAGYRDCPVEGYNEAVADAVNSGGVRYLKLPPKASLTPLEDSECEWKTCSPSTVRRSDAVPYYFGRLLYHTLGIPIGLVQANMGGTRAESWMDEAHLKAHTDENLSPEAIEAYKPEEMRPMVWGNGTFWPIRHYTPKGIIFYQGASNIWHALDEYARLMSVLADQWREDFGSGEEVPFYYVEIVPYPHTGVDGIDAARLREQQFKAMSLIPNSFMIPTNDCVYPWEVNQIHPCQKQKIGDRLAYAALNKTYGFGDFICEGPTFREMKVSGDTVRVYLDHEHGAISPLEGLEGFEVAGEDRVFHKAEAYREFKKCIVVRSPEVPDPVAVRYCFRDFLLGNVTNAGGIPLYPFRTDDWR